MDPKVKTSRATIKRMTELTAEIDMLMLRNLLGKIKMTLMVEEGFEPEEVLDLVKSVFNKA